MRSFRFGVQADGPSDAKGWRLAAQRFESLGYHTLSMADHFENDLSPLPALAMAAAATTELHVGTWVLGNDFRHPAVVARDVATIAALSEGRFEFGIGAGWMTTDYTSTGIGFDSASVRIDRLAESAQMIRSLLDGETLTLHGEHYSIDRLKVPIGGTLKSPVPLMMGGGGPKMLRTAGALADIVGVNFALPGGTIGIEAAQSGTAERTSQKLAWIREGAGPRFDEIEIQTRVHLVTVVDDPSATVEALAASTGLTGLEIEESPHSLIGSVPALVDKIEYLRSEFGITYFTWGSDQAEAMAPVVAKLR